MSSQTNLIAFALAVAGIYVAIENGRMSTALLALSVAFGGYHLAGGNDS